MKETMVYVAIGCIFLLAIGTYLLIVSKKSKEENLESIIQMIKRSGQVAKTNIDNKMDGVPYMQKRKKYLEYAIDITESDETLDNLSKYQLLCILFSIIAFVLVIFFVGNMFFAFIIFAAGIFAMLYPEIKLKSHVKKKYADFDNALPDFISRISLAMGAGINLSQAMIIAAKALEGPIKSEFNRFLADIERNQDNISKPYLNLKRRIPTKSCERFCSVVITGVRNGNKMSDILEKETEYLNDELLTSMEEKAKKNEVTSTAISTGLIFLPITVLLIAPIMATSI